MFADRPEFIVELRDLRIEIPLDEGLLTPVRGVSFGIRPNETLGLVGESGCGKSLTAKAILCINTRSCRTTGQILFTHRGSKRNLVDRQDVPEREMREVRGKAISMVFQEPMSAFSPLFTIGHQLTEAVRLHIDSDRTSATETVLRMMQRVGIANAPQRFKQYPHEYSGGMLQRALIAMALVCRPQLLIADEPTTALDVTIQAQILRLMKDLQLEYGMAILYITHDLGTVATMCDRVGVMYLGRIVEIAAVREIFANPLHPYTKGLMRSVHRMGDRKERLDSIPGTVPHAMNLVNRCSFFERCALRTESTCGAEEPELIEVREGHFVSCFNVDASGPERRKGAEHG